MEFRRNCEPSRYELKDGLPYREKEKGGNMAKMSMLKFEDVPISDARFPSFEQRFAAAKTLSASNDDLANLLDKVPKTVGAPGVTGCWRGAYTTNDYFRCTVDRKTSLGGDAGTSCESVSASAVKFISYDVLRETIPKDSQYKSKGEGLGFRLNQHVSLFCDSNGNVDHVAYYIPLQGRKARAAMNAKEVRLYVKVETIQQPKTPCSVTRCVLEPVLVPMGNKYIVYDPAGSKSAQAYLGKFELNPPEKTPRVVDGGACPTAAMPTKTANAPLSEEWPQYAGQLSTAPSDIGGPCLVHFAQGRNKSCDALGSILDGNNANPVFSTTMPHPLLFGFASECPNENMPAYGMDGTGGDEDPLASADPLEVHSTTMPYPLLFGSASECPDENMSAYGMDGTGDDGDPLASVDICELKRYFEGTPENFASADFAFAAMIDFTSPVDDLVTFSDCRRVAEFESFHGIAVSGHRACIIYAVLSSLRKNFAPTSESLFVVLNTAGMIVVDPNRWTQIQCANFLFIQGLSYGVCRRVVQGQFTTATAFFHTDVPGLVALYGISEQDANSIQAATNWLAHILSVDEDDDEDESSLRTDASNAEPGLGPGEIDPFETDKIDPPLGTVAVSVWDGALFAAFLSAETEDVPGRQHDYLEHPQCVECVSFAPGRHLLATGCTDFLVRTWDSRTGDCIATLQGHRGAVICMTFLPDGLTLVTGSADNTLRLWRLHEGHSIALCGHEANVICVAVSSDEPPLIASGSYDNSARTWNSVTGECISKVDFSADVLSLAFIPTAPTVVMSLYSGEGALWSGRRPRNHLVRLVGLEQGALVEPRSRPRELPIHPMEVNAVACFPDGSIVTACKDGYLRIWDDSGTCTHQRRVNDNILAIAISPVGSTIALGTEDERRVRVWSPANNTLRELGRYWSDVTSVTFRFDGRVVASAAGRRVSLSRTDVDLSL